MKLLPIIALLIQSIAASPTTGDTLYAQRTKSACSSSIGTCVLNPINAPCKNCDSSTYAGWSSSGYFMQKFPSSTFKSDHGISTYADLSYATNEATLSYQLRLGANFDFVKGGKLPGLYIGDQANSKCSQGTVSGNCASVRIMFRTNGDGEAYLYLPKQSKTELDAICTNEAFSTTTAESTCKSSTTLKSDGFPTDGVSLGRGNFRFTPNAWNTVKIYVKLNTIGSNNGWLRVFFNGKEVIKAGNIKFVTDSTTKIRHYFHSVFFGGGDSSWATKKAETIEFTGITVKQGFV